jgi:hypothetical protein
MDDGVENGSDLADLQAEELPRRNTPRVIGATQELARPAGRTYIVIAVVLLTLAATLVFTILVSLPHHEVTVKGNVVSCSLARRFGVKWGSPWHDCQVLLDGASKPINALARKDLNRGTRVVVKAETHEETGVTLYTITPDSR